MKALGKVARKKKVAKSQLSDHTTESEREAPRAGFKLWPRKKKMAKPEQSDTAEFEHEDSDLQAGAKNEPPENPVPTPRERQTPEKKAAEVVVAIYDFVGTEQGDLSLTKGDHLTVIEKHSDYWWIAKNIRGEQGFIPSNYVRKQALESESWFRPEMSQLLCEDVLKKEGKEGCFVVRSSSREGMYTVSVLHGDNVHHYHIKKEGEQLYISDRHRYPTVPELINYHRHNSGGLVTRLRQPPSFGEAPVAAFFGHDIWEIPKSEIVLGKELIGASQFGTVREGRWRQRTSVAVKMMKEGAMSEDDLIDEAKVMMKFQHAHLLQLYGVCSERPIFIITEFMSQGCLLNYLRKHQTRLQHPEMTQIVRQVASAMAYLESRNFIHRDLAARNCLIGDYNIVKVAGFGLARYVIDDEYTASEGTKLLTKWAAPEVLLYSRFSSKSDIWAFGILAWEIYTGGKKPYLAISNTDAAQKVINGYRLQKPSRCPDEMYRIVESCWHSEPEYRPTFASVHRSVVELTGEDYDETVEQDTSVPPEIRARGPRAEVAYQKAMQNGKVEVYRGRIMLLGQARTGKTSLKKSLLGMPFDPEEESTIGIEPSKCEVELDEVKNWTSTEGKKPLEAEVVKDIARLMAKDLNEAAVHQKDMHGADASSDPEQRPASLEHVDALPTVRNESTPDITPKSISEIDMRGDNVAQSTQSNDPAVQRIQLKIDNTAPKDVTEQLLRYLKGLELEDENKAKEVTLTLWDFAGQHLYYASHSVFLSTRAVYVLVYNLSKTLNAQAEPCARQGIHEIVLDNPNDNTNLDNLLSWLVSVHSIRPTTEEAGRDLDVQEANLPYLRPPVLVVGTHADLQSPEDIKKMEECIQKSIFGTSYERHVIRPFFAVDNTNSRVDFGIQKLQKKIMDVVQQEPYMGEEVPLRWFNFEKVVEALVLKKTFHMNLGQLQTVITEVCHIDEEEELTAMLNFYHDLGVIVKHGQTVVLQAQWLIDLFKQLITVRPFHEMNPLYSRCWHELQERGILRMALVDHVFTDFIEKGLIKQDILDMMELYGLIAKFSCLSSEGEQEQKYFVPAQLTSSPSGLCEIKPTEYDPCPLYLHFLDDFVPHGLFSLLLSRCIGWCSRQGLKEAPQLYHNGARLFIGMQIIFDLILICRKRFIKVILKRRSPVSPGPSSIAASTKMAGEVRAFLEETMHGMSCELSYLRNIRYEACVACTLCLQSTDQCRNHKAVSCAHDDCLHLLPVRSEEELICAKSLYDETVKVYGLDKWLQGHKAENDERRLEFLTLEDSASLKCGTPSTDDLLLIAHELGSSWKMFGRALHLDEPVLEQIEEDERRLIEKCYGVLRKWLELSAPKATYQCLAKALEQCGRSDLAAKYCDACGDSLEDYAASSQSLSLKTGTPASDELLDIATEFCSSWKMFSRALRLHEPVVAQIEEEELKMVSKCYAVLLKWSENFGSEATYQCLAEALQHPVVGQSHLVVKFCTLQYAEK